mmetsp:Transcript_1233/g.1537  ORF Transcript_1233/g.1537 Transcript_1233/m.1537 type:complete len:152 (-) Transcript_1233:34-489(-)
MAAGTINNKVFLHSMRRYRKIDEIVPRSINNTHKADATHFKPSVAITAAEYKKFAFPRTAALITIFLTQFCKAKKSKTISAILVSPLVFDFSGGYVFSSNLAREDELEPGFSGSDDDITLRTLGKYMMQMIYTYRCSRYNSLETDHMYTKS